MTKGKLANARHEAFCHEYAKTLNGKKAAIAAKYAKGSAESKGSQLLRIVKVKDRIAELLGKVEKRNEISVDRTIQEIKAIAFQSITDIASWDGADSVNLKPSDELTDEQAASISSIENSEKGGFKLRRESKNGALKMLMDYHEKAGHFKAIDDDDDDKDQTVTIIVKLDKDAEDS